MGYMNRGVHKLFGAPVKVTLGALGAAHVKRSYKTGLFYPPLLRVVSSNPEVAPHGGAD